MINRLLSHGARWWSEKKVVVEVQSSENSAAPVAPYYLTAALLGSCTFIMMLLLANEHDCYDSSTVTGPTKRIDTIATVFCFEVRSGSDGGSWLAKENTLWPVSRSLCPGKGQCPPHGPEWSRWVWKVTGGHIRSTEETLGGVRESDSSLTVESWRWLWAWRSQWTRPDPGPGSVGWYWGRWPATLARGQQRTVSSRFHTSGDCLEWLFRLTLQSYQVRSIGSPQGWNV